MTDEGNRVDLEIAMGTVVAELASRPTARQARGGPRLSLGATHRQRAQVHRPAPRVLVRRTRRRDPIHPAGRTGPGGLHRALQSELSRRGTHRPPFRVDLKAARTDNHLASDLQPGAAARQRRAGVPLTFLPRCAIAGQSTAALST